MAFSCLCQCLLRLGLRHGEDIACHYLAGTRVVWLQLTSAMRNQPVWNRFKHVQHWYAGDD